MGPKQSKNMYMMPETEGFNIDTIAFSEQEPIFRKAKNYMYALRPLQKFAKDNRRAKLMHRKLVGAKVAESPLQTLFESSNSKSEEMLNFETIAKAKGGEKKTTLFENVPKTNSERPIAKIGVRKTKTAKVETKSINVEEKKYQIPITPKRPQTKSKKPKKLKYVNRPLTLAHSKIYNIVETCFARGSYDLEKSKLEKSEKKSSEKAIESALERGQKFQDYNSMHDSPQDEAATSEKPTICFFCEYERYYKKPKATKRREKKKV